MAQPKFPEIEEEILKYWDEHHVFEKSLEKPAPRGDFVFYDGPPFATGLPHYGHIVASLMKDIVPRFWTMRGYRVERKWGWDCHGLPVENIVEKNLNLSSRQAIEVCGVTKFNEACRAAVLTYVEEWKKTIRRIGRWVDMERDYKTMDLSYMESVWWVFKELWKQGLIYEGYKAMHICPRCGTPLSNFEVTMGYKDVKEKAVTVKFRVVSSKQVSSKLQLTTYNLPTYLLAWTTTPWTLPGNVLLAVNPDVDYVVVKIHNPPQPSLTLREGAAENSPLRVRGDRGVTNGDEYYILAKARLSMLGGGYEVVKELKGKDLVGLKYEALFPYYKDTERAFRVVAGDFVTTEDGTGVVHIAPAFGENDYQVGQKQKIPLVQHVGMDGRFKEEVADFKGWEVKPKDNPGATDEKIVEWLRGSGKLFRAEPITHSYPHCWRCDTPLLNYATSSWFVRVTELKKLLLSANKKTNWVPEYIKEGRFGKWLEGARDWAISRNRFWGTPLPVWRCQTGNYKLQITNDKQNSNSKCQNIIVVGSVAELEKLVEKSVGDLHKHIVDELTFPCKQCGGTMKRIPEVLDCWFESGSMPYGQMHYPFENKDRFEAAFPAEFIAEGQDQTRGWFYTLHVLAVALTRGKTPAIPIGKVVPAFQNVIVNGIVLAEDGKKMAKRLKNYPEPEAVINKYGADALRYYFATSPVMHAENLNFSEAGVREMYNKVVSMLLNVVEFYKLYAPQDEKFQIPNPKSQTNSKLKIPNSKHILDKWIAARLHQLIQEVTENMEAYKLSEASRPIQDFIADLSQWYLRRSRDRFKGKKSEKRVALLTTRYVLHTLSQVLAPFMPFLAEHVYREIRDSRLEIRKDNESPIIQSSNHPISVHLSDWPKLKKAKIDTALLEEMSAARKVVELAHAARAEAKLKVRQPLGKLEIGNWKLESANRDVLLQLIAEEVNVREVTIVPPPKSSTPHPNPLPQGERETVAGEETIGNSPPLVGGARGGGGWITKTDGNLTVSLNTELTPELKKEGLARELTRLINDARKAAGLTPSDKVDILIAIMNPHPPLSPRERVAERPGEGGVRGVVKEYQKQLRKAVLARAVKLVNAPQEMSWSYEIPLENNNKIWVGMRKV
ncbi:isoleucine--tRNA ligase [Candidatus Uhrbacteria bacterium]|nr:isoleucine--tRNA ligase [Candidatus Uhrbacteria bacterium]